jgi:hypothetical protein
MSENKPVLVALVITGLALVGLGVYFFSVDEPDAQSVTESVPVVAAPTIEKIDEVTAAPVIEPKIEAVASTEPLVETPSFVLPRLDNSDQLIRDGAVSLTRHEGINSWLGGNELIRKTVVFVDNIANGTIAREPAAALAPRSPIAVTEVSDGVYVIDERSYERFNVVTNIFLSIDTKRAVEFYVLLRPLFSQAYSELGYPAGDFDQVILNAVGRLLETPTFSEPAKLIRPVVMYEYQDQNLEAMSPAQKQLLRLGPKHGAAVKVKLGDLARELRSAIE